MSVIYISELYETWQEAFEAKQELLQEAAEKWRKAKLRLEEAELLKKALTEVYFDIILFIYNFRYVK